MTRLTRKIVFPMIGTLYERVISNLNSEIAFLKEQLATKDKYSQEEIIFLQKRLKKAFQKLTNNEYHCSRIKKTFHQILPNKIIGQREKRAKIAVFYILGTNPIRKHIQTLKSALGNLQIKLIQQMVEAKKHIQNPRHIQNTVITSVTKRFFGTLCNPDIFRIIAYSLLWDILKSKHIQNPAKYLKWDILLRTLCNYSKFRPPIFKTIQNYCVFRTRLCQLLLKVSFFFRTTNLLLYSLLFIKIVKYSYSVFQLLLMTTGYE